MNYQSKSLWCITAVNENNKFKLFLPRLLLFLKCKTYTIFFDIFPRLILSTVIFCNCKKVLNSLKMLHIVSRIIVVIIIVRIIIIIMMIMIIIMIIITLMIIIMIIMTLMIKMKTNNWLYGRIFLNCNC